jgi:hypothetical protein
VPAPLTPIFILIEDWDGFVKGNGDTTLGLFLFFMIAIYIGYILFRSKRVFYKEGKLIMYKLFSNKIKILDKKNVGAIETFFPFSPFI